MEGEVEGEVGGCERGCKGGGVEGGVQRCGGAEVQDLHVGGEVVAREARGAEVDDLNLTARVGLDEDVLRLEVAVDQVEACKVEVG